MDATSIVPSAGLQRALTKALGTVHSVGPQVEYLQNLAKACPEIAAQVDELGIMHEHLDKVCRVGLGGMVSDLGDDTRG